MRHLLLISALVAPCALRAQTTVATTSRVAPSATVISREGSVPMAAAAVRPTTAPVLDGRGDDAVWLNAPEITGFRQFEPNEDGNPSYATSANRSAGSGAARVGCGTRRSSHPW